MDARDDDTRPPRELARERTDWAEDRTALANERTFAGWMRTGLAALAVAIGLRAVFGPFEPTWVAKAVASSFVLVALLIFVAAERQARRTAARLHAHAVVARSARTMTLIAAVMGGGAVAVGAILWLL